MIKISVDKKTLSIEQMTALNRFEQSLTVIIKQLLKRKEYSHLRVLPSFEIVKRSNCPIDLTVDANCQKRGSYSFVDDIKKWIEQYDELEVYIPNNTLKIDLKIMLSDSKAENVSKEANDLPNFTPSKPRYSFDKVILPDDVKKRIMADLSVIKHTELIYKTWGFEEIDGIPRLVLSLYGKPGTGKTMIAHAIANYFSKPLLALNYSEIESKYVGDAAKNLKHAFDTAKELGAVLFFDEADSFLGKRIQNVSQGAEQAINSLRSQMLILLEEHEGIVLFATNLVANFDKAFESRFLDSIEIPLPNREARAAIIKSMIPSKLPLATVLTDEDFLNASNLIEGLAGREIKNAILKMLLEFDEDSTHLFSVEDICNAMKQKKKEIEQLHTEINLQDGRGQKINASPDQLDKVKDALKESMQNAPEVKVK
mgnify:CR=1 FL=1